MTAMQISEVVNSMKDLIDYSRESGTGPMGKHLLSAVHCYKQEWCYMKRLFYFGKKKLL